MREEFKGSRGPWAAHGDEESMATSVVMSEFGAILCIVGTYMTSMEEDYANANLIAAAPELLEALQELVHADTHGIKNCSAQVNALEKAKSAINKALGK